MRMLQIQIPCEVVVSSECEIIGPTDASAQESRIAFVRRTSYIFNPMVKHLLPTDPLPFLPTNFKPLFVFPASLFSPHSPFIEIPRATRLPTMSDPSETPWSTGPNAPQIPSQLYLAEKVSFAGILIGAISYGALTHTPTHSCSPCLLGSPF